MADAMENWLDHEIDLVASSPESDADAVPTFEEEALKVAEYIARRRSKMKPSLRSLTNLANQSKGVKTSVSSLKSFDASPQSSPVLEEEIEDDAVPTADLLNMSPVYTKRKHRHTMVSQELQDMFGFDATPLPKTKVKQRRVTVKSPCRSDVQTEKENTTLSTVSQDQCLHSAVNATSSKGTPSVIEHSQVTQTDSHMQLAALPHDIVEVTRDSENGMNSGGVITRSRSRLSIQPDTLKTSSISKSRKTSDLNREASRDSTKPVSKATHPKSANKMAIKQSVVKSRINTGMRQTPVAKNLNGKSKLETKLKQTPVTKPINVKSKIDTGRGQSAVANRAPSKRLSLNTQSTTKSVPQTPNTKTVTATAARASCNKTPATTSCSDGMRGQRRSLMQPSNMRTPLHSTGISKAPSSTHGISTPIQTRIQPPSRPSSATVGQLTTPVSAVPKRLQLTRKCASVQPKRSLHSSLASSRGITRIQEVSPPVGDTETPRPSALKKPSYGMSGGINNRGPAAGRRSLHVPSQLGSLNSK